MSIHLLRPSVLPFPSFKSCLELEALGRGPGLAHDAVIPHVSSCNQPGQLDSGSKDFSNEGLLGSSNINHVVTVRSAVTGVFLLVGCGGPS